MNLQTGFVLVILLLAHTVWAATHPTNCPLILEPEGKPEPSVAFWLETSLKRVFPRTDPGGTNLQLLAARNSRIAFQACFKNRRVYELNAECRVLGAEDLKPQIRYVGFVPMHHLTPNTNLKELDGVEHPPGLVPDPLWPLTKVTSIGPNESRSFWITLHIPANAKPGMREFKARPIHEEVWKLG